MDEEFKQKIGKYIKENENKSTAFQNLWDAPKAVLRGRFIRIHVYLKKQEKSRINNLTYNLKELEKDQSTKSAERRE